MIRRAELRDIDRIAEIEEVCFPKDEAARKVDFENRMKIFSNHFFVAEEDNVIVGFINGMVIDERVIRDELYENPYFHTENGRFQTVFGLDVIPEYRDEGFGRDLLVYLISHGKEEGRQGVILTCKDELIGFYEKIGFCNKGISQSVHGNAVWNDMELIF